MLETINRLLNQCSTKNTKFPPTDLYNEGWMLRIVLDWYSMHPDITSPIAIPADSDWYSEAKLPSTFLHRKKGDKYAEGYTHADGVIGQFSIGVKGVSDLKLKPNANRFVVIEAKMFSKLSAGTTHAKYYDQAARNVACMAEIIRRADISLSEIEILGFFVLAPESRIDEGVFEPYMNKQHIENIVKQRVDSHNDDKSGWFSYSFLPVLDKINVKCISWEELVKLMKSEEPDITSSLTEFYSNCIKYNSKDSEVPPFFGPVR